MRSRGRIHRRSVHRLASAKPMSQTLRTMASAHSGRESRKSIIGLNLAERPLRRRAPNTDRQPRGTGIYLAVDGSAIPQEAVMRAMWILLATTAVIPLAGAAEEHAHWSYSGATGPDKWS